MPKKQPIESKSVTYIIKAAFEASDPNVRETLDEAVDVLRERGIAMVVDMQLVDKPLDDAFDVELEREAEFNVRGKELLAETRLILADLGQALRDIAGIANTAVADLGASEERMVKRGKS